MTRQVFILGDQPLPEGSSKPYALLTANPTKEHHYIAQTEQRQHAHNPQVSPQNQNVYRLPLSLFGTHPHQPHDERKKRKHAAKPAASPEAASVNIIGNLAAKNLYTLTFVENTGNQYNLESWFNRHESGYEDACEHLRTLPGCCLKTSEASFAKTEKGTSVRNYPNKQALLDAVQTALDKYLAEFADIPESARNIRAADGGKTPSEHLSYQLGWVHSLLDWERREQAGEEVHTPAEGFKWNNLGGLYQRFYQAYGVYTLAEQQAMLRGKTAELCAWIEGLSEDELFLAGQRKWAETAARWPLWKWIHINTVAPFTNFRTKIRKWKREMRNRADE